MMINANAKVVINVIWLIIIGLDGSIRNFLLTKKIDVM